MSFTQIMDPNHMYQHPPLDYKGKEIRLLHVEPRIRGKPISCQLKTAVLNDATRYAALSYTWGDDHHVNMPRILLNGKVFQVRKNLYNFLARVADEKGEHQLLWIDALCIDQCNLRERNHQVAIMGEIYSRAEKVIIWLGVGTQKTNEQLMSLSIGLAKSFKRVRISEWSRAFADCILCLCWTPYWTRVWIVQEVVLASKLELRCGTQRIDGNELIWLFKTAEFEFTQASGAKNMQSSNNNLVAEILLSSPAMHIIRHRIDRIQSYPHQRGLAITSLHDTFSRLQCKDPRDRIYGMLALANLDDLALVNVTPDYTKPVEEVLLDWRLKLFKYRWMLSYPRYLLPPRVEGLLKCGVGENHVWAHMTAWE